MKQTKQVKKPVPKNNNRPTKVGGNNKKVKKSPLIKSSKQELAYRVPECVHHFMHALVDPFDAPAGACLPCDLFPLPSAKYKVFVRGRCNLGTAGIGYACLTPTSCNDASFLQCTTASSVLPSTAALNTATNVANLSCTQNQFTQAQLTNANVATRMVAYGIRVKYVGQLMDRNGVVTAYEDPDHQDSRRFSYDQLNSNPYSDIHRVGAELWDSSVCGSGPVTPGEVEFLNLAYPLGTAAPIVCAISGLAGDLYEIEGYCHYELIGLLVANKTKSHAEPSFFGKVVEAAKSITDSGPLSPAKGPTLWETFTKSIRDGLPQVITMIGNAVAPGVGNIAGLVARGLSGPAPDSVFRTSMYGTRQPERLMM